MNLLLKKLNKIRKNKGCALIPFLTAGYPNINLTIKALIELDLQGADFIELGIPYSEALGDGPLIQNSSKIALNQHIYLTEVLDLISKSKNRLNTPIILFTYYNLILVRGVFKFILEIYKLNILGLIIPDLPIEEIDYLNELCDYYDIELILFIAPTSSISRINFILSKASECIYLVQDVGVTGIRTYLNYNTAKLSSYIKSKTNKFLILGFGISSVSQVNDIIKWNIDGIVVGSAFTRIFFNNYLNENSDINVIKLLGEFCKELSVIVKK
uniref:Tryptophan synthase alpha chain n=1 Tax=Leachiella pacifica TaxID=282357 RepID=A0A3S8UVV6_9FLOR|nr:tryptophan synthase alpha subunit [Leachiella pacifica]